MADFGSSQQKAFYWQGEWDGADHNLVSVARIWTQLSYESSGVLTEKKVPEC